jgi:hypothetical protein
VQFWRTLQVGEGSFERPSGYSTIYKAARKFGHELSAARRSRPSGKKEKVVI